MPLLPTLLFGIGGGALLVWLLGFAAIMIATRPHRVLPDPPTDVLGISRPAVVNLLANQWRCTTDAVRATLVDLIARGYLAVPGGGADPVIEIHEESPPSLTRYERRLLDRLRTQARGGRVNLPALEFGSERAASRWLSRFAAEVVADAKARDLARPGVDPDFLVATALVPSLSLAAWTYQQVPSDKLFSALAVLVAMLLGLAHLGIRVRDRYRPTPAGRIAASHWLGVRSHLREHHPELASAGLDDPTLTEPHGGYAVALGLAGRVSERVRVAPTRTRQIAVGGAPEGTGSGVVRVRFPHHLRFCWGWGALGAAAAAAAAALGAVVLGVILNEYGGHLPRLLVTAGWLTLVGLLVCCAGLLLLAAADVAGSTERTGSVVLLEPYARESANRYVLAVIDRAGGPVDAWILPGYLGDGLAPGCTVTVRVRRWTGLVSRLAVLAGPGAAPG